jgi:hypothetical protein
VSQYPTNTLQGVLPFVPGVTDDLWDVWSDQFTIVNVAPNDERLTERSQVFPQPDNYENARSPAEFFGIGPFSLPGVNGADGAPGSGLPGDSGMGEDGAEGAEGPCPDVTCSASANAPNTANCVVTPTDPCNKHFEFTFDIPGGGGGGTDIYCVRLTARTRVTEPPNTRINYTYAEVTWNDGTGTWDLAGGITGIDAINKAEYRARTENHYGLPVECGTADDFVVELWFEGTQPVFDQPLPNTFIAQIFETPEEAIVGDDSQPSIFKYKLGDDCNPALQIGPVGGLFHINEGDTPAPWVSYKAPGRYEAQPIGGRVLVTWRNGRSLALVETYERPVVVTCPIGGAFLFNDPNNSVNWWFLGAYP